MLNNDLDSTIDSDGELKNNRRQVNFNIHGFDGPLNKQGKLGSYFFRVDNSLVGSTITFSMPPGGASITDSNGFNVAYTTPSITLNVQNKQTFYRDSDGDGFGNPDISTIAFNQPNGFVLDNTDFDDNDSNSYPGAPEILDGKDNDGDGLIDEGFEQRFYRDADGDGFGDLSNFIDALEQPNGYVSDNTDFDDNDSNSYPGAPEICDNKDNNGNGQIDEGVTETFYSDSDGDGFGNPSNSVEACSIPNGFVSDNTDVNDSLFEIDNDGLDDDWEIQHFGNLNQGPNDDPDNDGLTNLEEFQNGTDPNSPSVSLEDLITSVPSSQTPGIFSAVTLSLGVSDETGVNFQWYKDGKAINGATNSDFTISNYEVADVGIYNVVATKGNEVFETDPVILGLGFSGKLAGDGTEVISNRIHPNGNIYDLVKMTGASLSVRADSGQITRITYIEGDNDIKLIEFSGSGTLTVNIDNVIAPVEPNKYILPGVAEYVKGSNLKIVISGADGTTHFAVFTLGDLNAGINSYIGEGGADGNGIAKVKYAAIIGSGNFGGMYLGNVEFSSSEGVTGIYAPEINPNFAVAVMNIKASGQATPYLLFNSQGSVRITGGNLFQSNGRTILVGNIGSISMSDGRGSDGTLYSPQQNQGRLEHYQTGEDVTNQVIVNPWDF